MSPLIAALLGLAAGLVIGALASALRARGVRERDEHDQLRRLAAAEQQATSEGERREELLRELAVSRESENAARGELAALRERLDAAERFAAEQKQFVETSRKELEDSFQSLAATALRGNTEEFLKLADTRWSTSREQAARDLDDRRRGIESLLSPLKDTLTRLESRTGDLEKAREGAYRGLAERLEGLQRATSSLEERTTSLATALRGTRTQGRWGEIALKNVVELAGLSEHVDFEEQDAQSDGKRPDMVVKLPGGRFIAVDSKVSLNAYLEAAEARTDEERDGALDRHVASLRTHIRTLAARDYAQSVPGQVDLVVLFLPGDPFLSAAFERSPDLQGEALRSRILVATPTTLVALLRTVAIYWQQRAIADNAERIAEAARELYDRGARFGAHLEKVGKGLADAVDAYNGAVGSFERRFLPMARKLEDFQVTDRTRRELDAPAPVEEMPRPTPTAEEDSLDTLPLFEIPALDSPASPRKDDE